MRSTVTKLSPAFELSFSASASTLAVCVSIISSPPSTRGTLASAASSALRTCPGSPPARAIRFDASPCSSSISAFSRCSGSTRWLFSRSAIVCAACTKPRARSVNFSKFMSCLLVSVPAGCPCGACPGTSAPEVGIARLAVQECNTLPRADFPPRELDTAAGRPATTAHVRRPPDRGPRPGRRRRRPRARRHPRRRRRLLQDRPRPHPRRRPRPRLRAQGARQARLPRPQALRHLRHRRGRGARPRAPRPRLPHRARRPARGPRRRRRPRRPHPHPRRHRAHLARPRRPRRRADPRRRRSPSSSSSAPPAPSPPAPTA